MAKYVTRRQIREGAASALGLLKTGAITGESEDNHTLVIPDMGVKLPDDFHLQNAWVMPRDDGSSGNTFSIIKKPYFSKDTNSVFVNDGGDWIWADVEEAGVYFLLAPDDWNKCINEALASLVKRMRVPIVLESGVNEYDTSLLEDSEGDLCTWLQSRNQIITTEWRRINGDLAFEGELGGQKYMDDNNKLVVQLQYLPFGTGSSLVLVCRKPYTWVSAPDEEEQPTDKLLEDDADLSTIPYQLALYATQVKALELMFNVHGVTAMRNRYGAQLSQARGNLINQRLDWEPPYQKASPSVEERFVIDIDPVLLYPAW